MDATQKEDKAGLSSSAFIIPIKSPNANLSNKDSDKQVFLAEEEQGQNPNDQNVDPLGLSQIPIDYKSKTIVETDWKQSVSGTEEYAAWSELSSSLASQIQREDGFVIKINGFSYRYRALNGGMVYRTKEVYQSREQSISEKTENRDQLVQSSENLVSIAKNDGSTAEIILKYRTSRVAWVRQLTREKLEEEEQSNIVERLFNLSKEKKKIDFNPLRTKQEQIEITENVLLFQIYTRYGRKFTRTISGGNYDFMGGSETGYLVTISCKADDDYSLRTTITIMRELGFACHLSNFSAYCFLSNTMPTIAGQRELLNIICNRAISEFMQSNV